MASNYSAIACPHCNCCATEDDYYKTGEKFICCFRCGYNYEKIITSWKGDAEPVFTEKEQKGYGVCRVQKLDGKRSTKIYNRPLTNEEIIKQATEFLNEDINRDESYFVIYRDNEFLTLAGTPPKNFYIPFEEYKKDRESNNQQLEIIVPF
ncbi:MAG TPA: hypothetical protein VK072_01405 [Candidatus Avamphibacillus sp.]|nr:hypothetical protein [Candidatus Avamphibacillus sp.]